MELLFVVLLIVLSIAGTMQRQKKQQEREAARRAAASRAAEAARGGEGEKEAPPPARSFPAGPGPFSGPTFPFPGPRLPQDPQGSAPAPQPAPGPRFPGALPDDDEGEPEEPQDPALWRRRAEAEEMRRQWEEGRDSGAEGADENGVTDPTVTVREHLRAAEGRNEAIGGADTPHTEGAAGPRPAAPAAAPAQEPAALPPQRLRMDKNAVIGGLVMSEILGKPKALRRR